MPRNLRKLSAPYHIADQHAAALLGPVTASLAALEARLAQYAERLHMSEADRLSVAEAYSIVAQAREKVAELTRAAGRGAGEG